MPIDRREDAGEFYPGGKVISTRPVATGGDVKHSDFAGLGVKTNTIPDLREAVRELGRRLGATVVTTLAACVAVAATVQTVPVNNLDFDANPPVVTNVTFEGLADATNVYTKAETDAAIAQIPPPDLSTNNTELVETIHQTEVDPTVPAWAKKTVGVFYLDDLYSFLNRDFYANDSSIKSQHTIWLKGSSNPTVTVGRDKLSDNTFPYTRQTVLGFSAYEGSDYYAHYRPRGIYIWPWWDTDAENAIAYLFPTNGNGGTFALTSDIAGKQDDLPYPTNAIPYAAITGKPTNVSAFNNDAGYLTGYTETDPTVPQWAKAQTKPTYTASEVGATTPEDVTAAIREQSLGGIWDETLQVWWTPRMRNGSLTYEATTNVNLNAEN